MNRDKALERAIELKEHSKECESVSFLESDSEFFDYVVSLLERTAPEVPVQEQYEFSSKCNICSYENKLKVTRRINPKFCMNCGEKITYQSNLLP